MAGAPRRRERRHWSRVRACLPAGSRPASSRPAIARPAAEAAVRKAFHAAPRRPRRMPPFRPCPNCGQDEWLANDGLHYMPRVHPDGRGGYEADPRNGIHVRVWRCNNCMYVAQFWEPD